MELYCKMICFAIFVNSDGCYDISGAHKISYSER